MYIAGIDIGGTSVKIGILEEGKGLVWRTKIPSRGGDPAPMVEAMAKALEGCPYPVERVGVGTAGSVRTSDQTVTTGNLGWAMVPLKRMLEERLGKPVWVDNDAQAALAAELYDGACQGEKYVIYLTLGTGIGGALLIDGKPWRGPEHTGAELGHIITHAHGRRCGCGRRGCFEVYGSASALSRILHRPTRAAIEAVRSGDPEACRLFSRYVDELAIGITSLYMVFTPKVVVVGGGVSALGDPLRLALQKAVDEAFAPLPYYTGLRIEIARHGNEAGMLGAAALARSAG